MDLCPDCKESALVVLGGVERERAKGGGHPRMIMLAMMHGGDVRESIRGKEE
jgi:hypothetical protein